MSNTSGLLSAARALYDKGFAVVPIAKGTKQPAPKGWQLARMDWSDLERRIRDNGIGGIGVVAGALSGQLAVLDFDGAGWAAVFALFLEAWPELRRSPKVVTQSGKRHVWLRCPDMPADFGRRVYERPDLDSAIELRGNRHNCVCPPSMGPTGGRYSWAEPEAELLDVAFAELQAWLAAWAGNPGEATEQGDAPTEQAPTDGCILGPAYWLQRAVEQARKGNRHDVGRNLALQLRAARLSHDAAEPYMLQFAAHCETLGACVEPAREHMRKALDWAYGLQDFAMQPVVVGDADGAPPPDPDADFSDGVGELPSDAQPRNATTAAPTVRLPTIWTCAALLATDFPEPRWVVPGLLPAGLALLAGRPKLGKSWLALQLACAVASGGSFLGRAIAPGRALYVALEDSPRRMQGRIQILLPTGNGPELAFDWPSLATPEGVGALKTALGRGYNLVVVDTIARAATGRAIDWDNTASVTALLGPLQRAALDADVTLLVVDHLRKPGVRASDTVDDVSGSTAKTGVADVILSLFRERGQHTATLKATGRDIEEAELAIAFDRDTRCWQATDPDAPTDAQARILTALRTVGAMTVTELADSLSRDRSLVSRELAELAQKGKARKRSDSRGAPWVVCL